MPSTGPNLIGQTYGDLLVTEEGPRTNNGARRWACECIHCGKPALRLTNQLLRQPSTCTSCRAKRTGKKNYKGTSHISGKQLCRIRTHARERSLDFDLTCQDLQDVWDAQGGLCAYTGRPMDKDTWSPERFDNEKGYVKGNIKLTLLDVNLMKRDHTYEEFVKLCKLVVENATIT